MQCVSISAYNECYTPSPWNFVNITRPFSLIYYAIGGSAFYTVDGREMPFEKGHLYILPANKVLSLREDPRDKFHLTYIHAFTSPEIASVIDIDAEKDEFAQRLIALIRIYVKQSGEIYVRKLLDTLLSYVTETRGVAGPSLPFKIKEYIDSDFVSSSDMSVLSRRFNYSRSHLTRVFKEKYNLTPKQYAQQLILKESAKLLSKGCSVAEIAERLNFSSPENFSRFFRSYYGYPPSEYKKRLGDFSL